jgi:hypothetical protein
MTSFIGEESYPWVFLPALSGGSALLYNQDPSISRPPGFCASNLK